MKNKRLQALFVSLTLLLLVVLIVWGTSSNKSNAISGAWQLESNEFTLPSHWRYLMRFDQGSLFSASRYTAGTSEDNIVDSGTWDIEESSIFIKSDATNHDDSLIVGSKQYSFEIANGKLIIRDSGRMYTYKKLEAWPYVRL